MPGPIRLIDLTNREIAALLEHEWEPVHHEDGRTAYTCATCDAIHKRYPRHPGKSLHGGHAANCAYHSLMLKAGIEDGV